MDGGVCVEEVEDLDVFDELHHAQALRGDLVGEFFVRHQDDGRRFQALGFADECVQQMHDLDQGLA